MRTKPCEKTATPPSIPQALLALDPPIVIPEATRQRCRALLAEMLNNLINYERKEEADER